MLLHSESDSREFVAARCTDEAMDALDLLATRLREANAKQNLVAASTLDALWRRHIADSAQLLDHVSRETSPWIDLGAGAGFPGLVVAAMQSSRTVYLLESRTLRIQWLRAIICELGLQTCHVIGQDLRRIEPIEAAVISARALAPLHRLIRLSARFSTNATEWVLPKGRAAVQEIASLPQHLRSRFHVKQSVTDPDAGIVLARGRMDSRA